jgi:hypothetical protein
VSIKNSTNDTIVFIYSDQTKNDTSISLLSTIDKKYIVDIDTEFRNEYVVYPFEQRDIIKHSKWKHYPLNDSLKLTFYFFKFDTIKKFEIGEVINKHKVYKRMQFTTEEILKNGGKIEVK